MPVQTQLTRESRLRLSGINAHPAGKNRGVPCFFSDATKKGKSALELATEVHAKLLGWPPSESIAQ